MSTSRRTLAALVAALTAICVASCGNWVDDVEIVGAVGVSRTATGEATVVVVTCSGTVSQVQLFAPGENDEDEEDRPLATWNRKPAGGTTSLALDAKDLDPEVLYVVSAEPDQRPDDNVISQADFYPTDLESLDVGEVVVTSEEKDERYASRSAFRDSVCS